MVEQETLRQIRAMVYSPMVDGRGIGPLEVRKINALIERAWRESEKA